jgi:hypothetical protein
MNPEENKTPPTQQEETKNTEETKNSETTNIFSKDHKGPLGLPTSLGHPKIPNARGSESNEAETKEVNTSNTGC